MTSNVTKRQFLSDVRIAMHVFIAHFGCKEASNVLLFSFVIKFYASGSVSYHISFLAYFPYFGKIKGSLWDHPAVCPSVYPLICLGLWGLLAVCVPPPSFFIFYAVCVASKESRQIVLPRTSCVYYEITLLSVYVLSSILRLMGWPCCVPSASLLGNRPPVCVYPTLIFWFFMWSLSYLRKLGN
jgi:hypothetical protein